jgi:hypothetical protein
VSHHHSPEEDAFTARLVTDLEAAGADVWVDTSGITSDDFIKRINEGMEGRHWLVLVMTPTALASPWVQREVNVALNEVTAQRMRGVLPLVTLPCRERDIPLLWRTLHRYDATRDYASALRRVVEELGLGTPAIPPVPISPRAAASSRQRPAYRWITWAASGSACLLIVAGVTFILYFSATPDVAQLLPIDIGVGIVAGGASAGLFLASWIGAVVAMARRNARRWLASLIVTGVLAILGSILFQAVPLVLLPLITTLAVGLVGPNAKPSGT